MQSTLPAWVNWSASRGVVVLALDDDMCRLVATAIDRPESLQPRVDRLAELGHRHEIVDRQGLLSIGPSQRGLTSAHPQDNALLVVQTSAADHLGSTSDAVLGQRDPLGKVFFEHEAELSFLPKLRDLGRQVLPERPVVDPRQKRVELVSHVWPVDSAGGHPESASRFVTIEGAPVPGHEGGQVGSGRSSPPTTG